jgi:hypothetical protein
VTPEDYESFCGILLGFAEPRRIALSSTTFELYWAALTEWTIEDVRSAANILFKQCDWMPTPKDFEDLRRSATERAGVDAWEMARRAARSAIALGRVREDVTCGDALVDRAVATIGGYGAIALCETAWLHALERRFLQAYVEVREVAEIRAALPHFAALDALPPRSATGPSSVSAILSSQPRVVERGRAGEDNSGSSLA